MPAEEVCQSGLFLVEQSPNSFVAAGDLEGHGGRGGQRGKQAQAEGAPYIAIECGVGYLPCIKSGSIRNDGKTEEPCPGIDFVCAYGGGGSDLGGQVQSRASVLLYIVGDDLEEAGHSRPDAGPFGGVP